MNSFSGLGSSLFYDDEANNNLKLDQKYENKISLQSQISRGNPKVDEVDHVVSTGKRSKPGSEKEYDSDDCSLGSLGDLNSAISEINHDFFLQVPQNKKTSHSNESKKFHQVRTDHRSNVLAPTNRRHGRVFLKPRFQNNEGF